MKYNFKKAFIKAFFAIVTIIWLAGNSIAVSTKITRHSSGAELLKGKTNGVIVSSKGTIELARASRLLAEKFEDVWCINSIVVSAGEVYLGTSPNGAIYKYSMGELTKIYPADAENNDENIVEPAEENQTEKSESNEAGQTETSEPNTIQTQQHLKNEHIFAMSTDLSGRVLAAVSGDNCRLMRLEGGKMETVFEPNDAMYIFATAVSKTGDVYLGTGPEGKIYKLNSFCGEPEVVYDSIDKNILSLTTDKDGFLYAGSDSRGLIYKINLQTKKATVLYDSDQPEITALLFGRNGELYATGTSAEITQLQGKVPAQVSLPGRPETETEQNGKQGQAGLNLKIANTKNTAQAETADMQKTAQKAPKPAKASALYKINSKGFVTELFREPAVLFCLAEQKENLLIGTGNKAQLFTVDSILEEQAVAYEDQQAIQITAIAVDGDHIYIGTANPAKFIAIDESFEKAGTYISDLIDASQPAKWGKLQIEADIPEDCSVTVSCRSGNVKDINDPGFSGWSKESEVTKPVQLRCPVGRFCQYKLVLKSSKTSRTPVIRAIAVASVVENIAPDVKAINVEPISPPEKKGVFKITYRTEDENEDELIYKIDFRKIGWDSWIELADKVQEPQFEWDGKTVEDGRYEIRVTASDRLSNSTTAKLTGSRVSEPVVVDNTPPVIEESSAKTEGASATLELKVADALSVIDRVDYTIDSCQDWLKALPADSVYDTENEDFSIRLEALDAGEHIISVRVKDAAENIVYKNFRVKVEIE